MLLGHGCRTAKGVLPRDACFVLGWWSWHRLTSQCSASDGACSAASDALREQSSPQPCCSACAVSLSASSAIASGPETEPQGGSSRRRRRGVFVLVVERCRCRPTPSQRARLASAGGPRTAPRTASSGVAAVPSRLGPHRAYAVGRTRRRPDAVAAWPPLMGQAGVPVAGLVAQPKTAECTQRPRRLGHSSPSPGPRVAHVWSRERPARGGFR